MYTVVHITCTNHWILNGNVSLFCSFFVSLYFNIEWPKIVLINCLRIMSCNLWIVCHITRFERIFDDWTYSHSLSEKEFLFINILFINILCNVKVKKIKKIKISKLPNCAAVHCLLFMHERPRDRAHKTRSVDK